MPEDLASVKMAWPTLTDNIVNEVIVAKMLPLQYNGPTCCDARTSGMDLSEMRTGCPMLRPFCRCKIHHATVTSASLDYVGSMTIPEDIMRQLNIVEGEQVDVANLNNGERWTTYALTGGKVGDFCLNGAAARLGQVGDRLIIMIYAFLDEKEVHSHRMKIAFLDAQNNVVRLQE